MYLQTSGPHQNYLYKVVDIDDQRISRSNKYLLTIKKNHTNTFFKFHGPVFLSADSGQALVVMTQTPEAKETYASFILSGSIMIPASVYFNTIALTPTCTVYLQATDKDSPDTYDIIYQVKTLAYQTDFELQDFFALSEMTLWPNEEVVRPGQAYYEIMVTMSGELTHQIGDHQIETQKNDAILYYRNQQAIIRHTTGEMASYLSITFDAEGIQTHLKNQPLTLSNLDLQQIKEMEALSQTMLTQHQDYDGDKMRILLSSLMVRLLRQDVQIKKEPISSMRSNYENHLFHVMVTYLKENIERKNEVNDLVDHFNLSRSTIQNLFLKYANSSPKTYINQVRLNRSKEMMRNSQLTISEIAEKLGYGSIQYFSRAFSREFGMSPSTYAKSILK